MSLPTNVFHVADGDNIALLQAMHQSRPNKNKQNKIEIHLAENATYQFSTSYQSNTKTNCDDFSNAHSALGVIPLQAQIEIFGNGALFECMSNGSSSNSLRFAIVLGHLSICNARFHGGNVTMDCGGGSMVLPGGGAFVVDAEAHLILNNCEFKKNCTFGRSGESGGTRGGAGGGGGQGGLGGAILCMPDSFFEANDCVFANNSASGGSGGAAYPNGGLFNSSGGSGGGYITSNSSNSLHVTGRRIATGQMQLNHSRFQTPLSEPASDASVCVSMSSSEGGKAGEPGVDAEYFGAGGGGGGSGTRGTHGGRGAFPGGGGGGAGGKTLGGYDGVGSGGCGGLGGGGQGGIAGNGSGSGGGGGAGLGGAICAIGAKRFVMKRSVFQGNRCGGGDGGVHPWGWCSGQSGKSIGGAVFLWGNSNEHSTMVLNVYKHNCAEIETDVFDKCRFSECHLSLFVLCKTHPLVAFANAWQVLRENVPETHHLPEPSVNNDTAMLSDSSGEVGSLKTLRRVNVRPLPSLIVWSILVEFVGWPIDLQIPREISNSHDIECLAKLNVNLSSRAYVEIDDGAKNLLGDTKSVASVVAA